MTNRVDHLPLRYDLAEVARESHTVNRVRDVTVNSLPEVIGVLSALVSEGFTGPVRIHMSQGGFSHVMTEESIRLVPNGEVDTNT
jgi:hypothetical protein